jgi:Concanavalin A-like lectin/glucanases superfamily
MKTTLSYFQILIISLAFAMPVGAQSFLTNGLVAYYPFNGNANDATGNGYNGTTQGAVLTTNRFGVLNSAYSFNGSSSYIQLPETLFGPTTPAFTVSLWVTTDSNNYPNQIIFEKGPANGEMNIGIGSDQFSFGANLCPPYNFQTLYTPMISNAVTHLVGVYLRGKGVWLYTNGVLATNMSIPNTNLWESSFPVNTALGIYDYTGGPYLGFRGHIEDVRIYTNAFTAPQVQQLYQYESTPPPPQSFITNGLVAYYPFNGNANDATGNGYNGTVQGAVLTTNRFGVPNSAYSFNGSSSYIQLPETIFGPTAPAFTVSLWATTDNGNYNNQLIFEKGPANGEMNMGISSSGQFSFGANLCPPYNFQQLYVSMISNAVTHLVGVYQQGEGIWLYTNGILATNMAIPFTNLWQSGFPVNTALGIYDYTGGPYYGFRGHIEDVRIYTNALTASQVQQLYQYESAPPPTSAPVVTNQPQDAYVYPYQNAQFSVGAMGSQPLSYQWLFDGSTIGNATNDLLEVTNIVQSEVGQYSVLITNYVGAVTSAVANLYMYPTIVDSFTGVDTYVGQTNLLSVTAWGSGTLDYQWYLNGTAILGATNATYDLSDVQAANAGSYYVVVNSTLGSVTNPPAEVAVYPSQATVGLYPGIFLIGTVGETFTIQENADLTDSNGWSTVGSVTLTQPGQLWVDTNTDASLPANPRRFYRIVPDE